MSILLQLVLLGTRLTAMLNFAAPGDWVAMNGDTEACWVEA